YVRCGYQLELSDDITWVPRVQIFGADRNKADFLVSGRYISLELEGDQANPWRLNSIDLEYRLQGRW
ncbi:unnamed protein product, partial [marine sediment metagenome]